LVFEVEIVYRNFAGALLARTLFPDAVAKV
jgi:hypothetical protein